MHRFWVKFAHFVRELEKTSVKLEIIKLDGLLDINYIILYINIIK